jgi:hypothetical protein
MVAVDQLFGNGSYPRGRPPDRGLVICQETLQAQDEPISTPQESSATRTVLRPDVEAGGRGMESAVSFDLPDEFRGHRMRAAVEPEASGLERPFPGGNPFSEAEDVFEDRFSGLDRCLRAAIPQVICHLFRSRQTHDRGVRSQRPEAQAAW